MMKRDLVLNVVVVVVVLIGIARGSAAAEHRVEVLNEPPPADGVSREILDQMSPTGFKIVRGASRTVCEIWICRQWETLPDFKASDTLLYPFEDGRLFGVIRFGRKGEDFRAQEIAKGVYTLRYAKQPVDGNHVGTSDTLDFLLLLPAADDTRPAPPDEDTLIESSSAAAGTTHPAMMSLLRDSGGDAKLPAIRHDQDRDLWSVRFSGKAGGGDVAKDLVVELVVAGHAEE